MNASDYAILVGIEVYPELGDNNSPLNLHGPGNDVDAIKAWLVDPLGGGLPADGGGGSPNIFEVKSTPAESAADARPTASELDRLMVALDAISRANRKAGKGTVVGRRVYIYMSGHGFSPGRQRACLYTADASERLGSNVHATGWLNWLQDAGYFKEYVLWIDACMNRQSFLAAHDPPLPLAAASSPPLANFVAYAAQRPLKAVEVAIAEDEGRVHGAFTWALLEGLRGAAADVNGRVTGRTLADWLRNSQVARFEARDRDDRDVAQEPEVIQEDSSLIFARGIRAPGYSIALSFPALAQGITARLWSGAPPRVVQEFAVAPDATTLTLRPGLYLVEVPDAGLRQGFEVVRPMTLVVDQKGSAVMRCEGDELFRLQVVPKDPGAEIFVIDSRFSLVDFSPASLESALPPGLFKIKMRAGNAINQQVILLDNDQSTTGSSPSAQLPATVIPLADTAATHEYHQKGRSDAVKAANALLAKAEQSVIMLMARTFSGKENTVAGTTPPWHGVSIVDAGGTAVVDLEQDGQRLEGDDGYAFSAVLVPPGAYYLRQQVDDNHTIEQSIIACPGWRTEVFVLRRVVPGGTQLDRRPRIAMTMRRHGENVGAQVDEEDRVVELAKQAMASERRVLSQQLEQMLMLKFRSPMAGIIGGHLLLIEQERDLSRDMSMLAVVVKNLRKLLGESHPDVEALALKTNLPAGDTPMGPPMFQRSWALLTAGAQNRRELVPAEMWRRVQASSALPPFMVWSTCEAVKTSSMQQIARVILGVKAAKGEEPAKQAEGAALLTAQAIPSSAAAPVATRLSRAAMSRAAALNVPPSALEVLRQEL